MNHNIVGGASQLGNHHLALRALLQRRGIDPIPSFGGVAGEA